MNAQRVIANGLSFTTRQDWPLADVLVLLLGGTGLLCDFLGVPEARILNVHTLFGAALLGSVCGSLLTAWNSRRSTGGAYFYLQTRRIAWRIYGLLYIMAAMRVFFYVAHAHEITRGAGFFNHLSSGASLDDFRVYLEFGLLAIVLVRLCALLSARARTGQDGVP